MTYAVKSIEINLGYLFVGLKGATSSRLTLLSEKRAMHENLTADEYN
jgi:hypothetical protein